MDRGIVAGNWKMHGSRQFLTDYVQTLDGLPRGSKPRLILFPPVGYLALLAGLLAEHGLDSALEVGAQNLHSESEGAFTGEMSGEMLGDLGARWVLVGHSERREYAGETNELVAEKVAAAIRSGLSPVLCVGETETERDAGKAESVVVAQLEAVLERCSIEALGDGAVAYEPVWAIGTGKTATPGLAQEMHGLIRSVLASRSVEVAERIPLLYGGSVKGENAGELFSEEDIDGGLVGGASLLADEFMAIAQSFPG